MKNYSENSYYGPTLGLFEFVWNSLPEKLTDVISFFSFLFFITEYLMEKWS